MKPDEYAIIVGSELEAIVSEEDAPSAFRNALREYRYSDVTLAK